MLIIKLIGGIDNLCGVWCLIYVFFFKNLIEYEDILCLFVLIWKNIK